MACHSLVFQHVGYAMGDNKASIQAKPNRNTSSIKKNISDKTETHRVSKVEFHETNILNSITHEPKHSMYIVYLPTKLRGLGGFSYLGLWQPMLSYSTATV